MVICLPSISIPLRQNYACYSFSNALHAPIKMKQYNISIKKRKSYNYRSEGSIFKEIYWNLGGFEFNPKNILESFWLFQKTTLLVLKI